MRRKLLLIFGLVWAVVAIGVGVDTPAWSGPIDPGFDLLRTPSQNTTVSGLMSASGGFITSDDVHNLHGVSVGPGNTDTIVQRLGGLQSGESGLVPAVIVAMHLRGTIMTLAGPTVLDIQLDPTQSSVGELNVTHDDPGGGAVDSFFDIFTVLSLDTPQGLFTLQRQDAVSSSNTPWSHTPGQGYVNAPQFPAGGFYITVAGIDHDSDGPRLHMDYATAIPEPSTLLLLGSGVVAVVGLGLWKKLSQKA